MILLVAVLWCYAGMIFANDFLDHTRLKEGYPSWHTSAMYFFNIIAWPFVGIAHLPRYWDNTKTNFNKLLNK